MKIHHINCATLCPLGGRLVYGDGPHRHLVCHCLLIESPAGLVLVDTGLGAGDLKDRCHNQIFERLARPSRQASESALAQVKRLGFAADDVRHILLTHLDIDHAGGLADFPRAAVHVMQRELETAKALPWHARHRYCASHWRHEVRWRPHDHGGERWFGFSGVVAPYELPPEILMIPLAGHSHGHAAIAVDSGAGWVLHCGDAYYHRGEVASQDERVPVALRAFAALGQADGARRVENVQRLKELASSDAQVALFCSHDPVEFETFRRANRLRRDVDAGLQLEPIDRV